MISSEKTKNRVEPCTLPGRMPKFIELSCVERVNTRLDGLRTGDALLFARIEPYSLKHTVSEKKLYRQLDQRYKINPSTSSEHTVSSNITATSSLSNRLLPPTTSISNSRIRQRRNSLPISKRHAIRPNATSTSKTTPPLEYPTVSPEFVLTKRGPLGQYAKRILFDELAKDSGSRKFLFYLIAILNASFPDYDFTDIPPHFFKRGSIEDLTTILESPIFSQHAESKAHVHGDLWDALHDSCENKLEECSVFLFEPLHEELDPLYEEGVLWSHLIFFCNFKLRRIVLLKIKLKTALSNLNREDDVELCDHSNSL